MRALLRVAATLLLLLLSIGAPDVAHVNAAQAPVASTLGDRADQLAARAVIRRDRFGVPHIKAESEEAAAFAHGYVTAEDHGTVLARLFLRARGAEASVFGPRFVDQDLRSRALGIYDIAVKRFSELPPYMQAILEGYAAGYSRFLTQHRSNFPEWATSVTGVDVLAHCRAVLLLDFALDLSAWNQTPRLGGSNMWAIGRGLSRSGHGMLFANPHLGWEGSFLFHEVQLTVPGVINVSGATLIGFPVVTIGFNQVLGWSHTVNGVTADSIYELTLDHEHANYSYDGRWLPLGTRTVALDVRTGAGTETRRATQLSSHYGPIIRTVGDKALAFKSANLDAVNFLTEYNAMAKALSYRSFADAINMQQLPTFNLGYADRDGNVWYVFNGRLPVRPSSGPRLLPGDTSRTEWFAIRPVSELPQLFNPKTGYVQNCNDLPWYTNLQQPIDPSPFAGYISPGTLGWRTQVSLRILSGAHGMTLDELKASKNNTEIVAAERLKDELIALLRARGADEWRSAADLLATWDNRVDANSRGAVLFLAWWDEYRRAVAAPFQLSWSSADPIGTPRGLGDPAAALGAFDRALQRVRQVYGAVDVRWGDIHRLRRGGLDLPVGGSGETLQNVTYRGDLKGSFVASGGDSYVLAVEFDGEPHAYSVLPYSESSNSASPYFNNQLTLYAQGEMKPAWFSEADIQANLARQYHPGE